MKKLRALGLLAAAVLIAGVTVSYTQSVQQVAESGSYSNGVYSNDLYRFSVGIPAGWQINEDEINKKLLDQSYTKLKENEAESRQKALDQSLDNTRVLFMARSVGTGVPVPIGVFACGIEKLQGVTTATQMAYSVANKGYVLKDPEAKLTKDMYSRKAGGINFTAFDVVVARPTVTLRQTYLITVRNGFAFFFVTTYNDDSMQEKMLNAVDTLSFKP